MNHESKNDHDGTSQLKHLTGHAIFWVGVATGLAAALYLTLRVAV